MLDCVDRHAHVSEADKEFVCQEEFNKLKVAAITGHLRYPYVLREYFVRELAAREGQHI